MITRLFFSALAVLLSAFILDGVTVDPWWWAVIVAIVLGFINACIRPLVKLLALPINFITLGLFTFVINGLMVMLCSWVVRPHFEVDNFWWALGFSIVLTLVSWALHLFMPSKKNR
jgi:putative membrane protein